MQERFREEEGQGVGGCGLAGVCAGMGRGWGWNAAIRVLHRVAAWPQFGPHGFLDSADLRNPTARLEAWDKRVLTLERPLRAPKRCSPAIVLFSSAEMPEVVSH